MSSIPFIRLSVDGLRQEMVAALTEHQAQMDADLREAVEQYCQTENIKAIIHKAARDALEHAITEEVKHFFHFGDGRKAVAEAVKESLLSNKTYTPLDYVGEQPEKNKE